MTSIKMNAVLDRFRDTVEPVRRKHGIKTVGYWTAAGTANGGTFVYLMAAAGGGELQKQEKEFGADPQFKEGYAASNKKQGKTVDKIVSLPLAGDATAKFSADGPLSTGFSDVRNRLSQLAGLVAGG